MTERRKEKNVEVCQKRKTTLHKRSQEPKQDDGSSECVFKLHLIYLSHPYLYYHSCFRKGFSLIIMIGSNQFYICFRLRHRKKTLGCPTNHGHSSLSLLIPSSVPSKSPPNISFYSAHAQFGPGCLRGCTSTCQQKHES